MNENNNAAIRRDNRAALVKFFVIILVAALVGGALGFSVVFFGLDALGGALAQAGERFSLRIAPWLLWLALAAAAMMALPIRRARRVLDTWDGEDEHAAARVDRTLTLVLWGSGLLTVLGFFLLAAVYSSVFTRQRGLPLSPVAAFLLLMAVCVLLQQKAVDLTRRMNPEKRGSVYDTKFRAKWLDSCDEAERAVIGRCAYKAYCATSNCCIALWLVLTLGALFFGTGLLPVLTVCVIWGVNLSVYCYWAARPAAKSTPPAP